MECDICLRSPSSELPFHCATCARNVLYERRLDAARLLLEKEQLGRKIDKIVAGPSKQGDRQSAKDDKESRALSQPWVRETTNAQRNGAEQAVADVSAHIIVLRDEIRLARDEISQRKASLAKRRAEMNAIKATVPERRMATTNKVAESSKKASQSWAATHNRTVETRAFLCREASILYRLRQKKRARGGVLTDQYSIGGLALVDLKDINGMKLTDLSASLSHVAHLLVLVSFYLAIRLPAEITLPHRDYPLPTIFTPANSYSAREVPFPGTTPTPSSTNSPAASRLEDLRLLPRPRPLFVESKDPQDKIPQFAKRDPTAFNFFLEGISLLAWDISWLCRTQGFNNGTESWEDVCNIGRNLWQLLLAQPQSPALMRVMSGRDISNRNKNGKESAAGTPGRGKSTPKLGLVSHASTYSFLGSAEAQEVLRGWKLSKYTVIVDPLKKMLIGEMNNAEWELLEEQEWDDGGERFDSDAAVHVKTRAMNGQQFDDTRSVMTAETRHEMPPVPTDGSRTPPRAKGTSGWTKVRGRDN